ncbi:hypothetical protein RJ639_042993 [Escallonia herrerae]|uniref:Uncharacterized protein n=1 Tax=Escallonia herrerae TaxID=1293975 RepID=A0AA88WAZ9_9ASTE|nr:hypothetical protein RJ639_042993 [Escallonia herrerae]
MKDAHVVEIPVDHEHQQKLIAAMDTISAIQHHPLAEISQSPGHLLLLKLWQREEDLFGRRITIRETRIDTVKREIFQLCCFFFLFHWFFLTILFTSHVDDHTNNVCRKWWIPSLLSVCTSVVIIFLVQVKLCRYWKMYGQLQREKIDNRALTRCIQELKMKGASFDLSKEPQNAKRMKGSSVEIKWKLLTCPILILIKVLVHLKLGRFSDIYEVLDTRPMLLILQDVSSPHPGVRVISDIIFHIAHSEVGVNYRFFIDLAMANVDFHRCSRVGRGRNCNRIQSNADDPHLFKATPLVFFKTVTSSFSSILFPV